MNRFRDWYNYLYAHNFLLTASNLPLSPILPVASTWSPQENQTNVLKCESGASKHFLRQDHAIFLNNRKKLSNPPSAALPNQTRIRASETGQVPLSSQLSSSAQKVLVFPHLTNASLLSIGQVCDDDCVAIFDKKTLTFTRQRMSK